MAYHQPNYPRVIQPPVESDKDCNFLCQTLRVSKIAARAISPPVGLTIAAVDLATGRENKDLNPKYIPGNLADGAKAVADKAAVTATLLSPGAGMLAGLSRGTNGQINPANVPVNLSRIGGSLTAKVPEIAGVFGESVGNALEGAVGGIAKPLTLPLALVAVAAVGGVILVSKVK